jgi:hypothetical protein
VKTILIALALAACGGASEPANECATPSVVVTCDEQNFYTFELQSVADASPTWLGSQCRTKPCAHGSACEVRGIDGTFIEGICR